MKKRLFLSLIILISIISVSLAEQKIASVSSVSGNLYINNQGASEWSLAQVNTPCYLYDTLKTDSNSYANLEFLTGSIVALNENTTVQITGTQEVTDQTEQSFIQTVIVTTGEIWAKITKQQEEIEFQTNGGVVAIKGTEFVIEENPETEETVVSLLEGEIAFTDNNNSKTFYNAGDEITIAWQGVPVVKHYTPLKLKEKMKNKYEKFKKFLPEYIENHPELENKIEQYMRNRETIKNPEEKAEKILAQLNKHIPDHVKEELKEKLDFPYKLSPSRETIETLNPTFSWIDMDKAEGYWLFLSDDENMDNLIWNKKVESNSFTYPADAIPLISGNKYYWRIIMLDSSGEPSGKASQTYFNVSQ